MLRNANTECSGERQRGGAGAAGQAGLCISAGGFCGCPLPVLATPSRSRAVAARSEYTIEIAAVRLITRRPDSRTRRGLRTPRETPGWHTVGRRSRTPQAAPGRHPPLPLRERRELGDVCGAHDDCPLVFPKTRAPESFHACAESRPSMVRSPFSETRGPKNRIPSCECSFRKTTLFGIPPSPFKNLSPLASSRLSIVRGCQGYAKRRHRLAWRWRTCNGSAGLHRRKRVPQSVAEP